MFEFALFVTTIAATAWMAHSLIKYVTQPKMRSQPIKIEQERKVTRRQDKRFP